MTKRFIIQIAFCVLIPLVNVSKDALPLGKIYLKIYVCELDIEQLFKEKVLVGIKTNLSLKEKEFEKIKNLKNVFCKSPIKLIN